MWFISELNEVISVSDLFRCPMVFILLCDLGREAGQRKLTTNDHFFFLVVLAAVFRLLKILGRW